MPSGEWRMDLDVACVGELKGRMEWGACRRAGCEFESASSATRLGEQRNWCIRPSRAIRHTMSIQLAELVDGVTELCHLQVAPLQWSLRSKLALGLERSIGPKHARAIDHKSARLSPFLRSRTPESWFLGWAERGSTLARRSAFDSFTCGAAPSLLRGPQCARW